MSTVAQGVTADDLLKFPRGKIRYELVKGELLSMSPAGSQHGIVVGTLFLLVADFVKRQQLGLMFGAESGFLLERDPDTVRAPDIAFVRRERVPSGGPPSGYWPGAPDLAVEVVSPGDTAREVDEKVAEWLRAGCQAVWIVNPHLKTVTVYSADRAISTLTSDQILGGDLFCRTFSARSPIFLPT